MISHSISRNKSISPILITFQFKIFMAYRYYKKRQMQCSRLISFEGEKCVVNYSIDMSYKRPCLAGIVGRVLTR